MREPNHFRVYFKRLINYKRDGVDYNLPLGETMKVAIAWSITTKDSRNTGDSLIRGQREGSRPAWLDMKLLEAPGAPQDESELTTVTANAKTGQATNAGTSKFDLSLGLTASGMRWC